MSFTPPAIPSLPDPASLLPAFTLPSLPDPAAVSSTIKGLVPPVPDAAFLNNVLALSNSPITDVTSGLFTNPLFAHMQFVDQAISSLKPLTSLASAADALPGAPGGASSALATVTSHMTDLTTMFSNMATNIVPVQLDMNPLIKSAVGSMSSIGSQSAEAMKSVTPFIQKLGIPSMGSVLNQASSEFGLNQLKGTVDAANPLPLLAHYSTMLSSMAQTAQDFLKTVTSAITSVISSAVTEFASAITSLKTSVESGITAFAAPIANFGSEMFNSVKDQMAAGTATLLRHMTEVNPSLAFNITGAINGTPAVLGGFQGMVTGNFASMLTKFPSPTKQAATSVPATTPVTNTVVTAVAKTSPDATATQLQAIAAQITLAKNDATAASAVAETAAQALQAYMSAQNYTATKNAQFDSPMAAAAYQNAKAALLASPQYLALDAANKDYETKRDAYGQLTVIQGYMQRNGPYPSNPNGPWYANGTLLVPPPTNPVL
jgi:hypothetical protein